MTEESLIALEEALDEAVGDDWMVFLRELNDGGVEALVTVAEASEFAVALSGDLATCERTVLAAKHRVLEQLMTLLTGGGVQ